jgi:RNA polymerase sigma-70 factor, ECF subfamily
MLESLAAVFGRHVDGAAPSWPPELERLLAEVVAVGRAAWPSVALSADDFVRHLAARYDGRSLVADWLGSVYAADLYLACACSLGRPAALAAFDERYLARIGAHLGQLRVDAPFVDDVRQSLREKLLIGSEGQPPRIAGYGGLGPLDGGWLRVVALRVALDLKRRRSATPVGDGGDVGDEAIADGGCSVERGYLRGRYQALFQSCLASSVAALSAQSRNLLRLHVIDGVTLEQLARLFRLSRATVVRRLADARAGVVASMRERVQAQLPISSSEFESLIADLVSQLDLSLSTVL